VPSRSYILAVGGSFLLPFCALVALIVPVVLGGNSLVAAEPSTRAVDWTAWDSLPVFYNGRVMPLVSFARQTVEIICGRTSPTLHPPKNLPPDAQKLFPDGKPRRFTASELVLSWMLYPQAWERIAFLGAGHEQLRTEILGLPSRDAQGAHLRWVSPADVASSEKLRELLEQIRERSEQAEARGEKLRLSPLEQSAQRLYQSYTLYRFLSFQPGRAGVIEGRFWDYAVKLMRSWRDAQAGFQSTQPVLRREAMLVRWVEDLERNLAAIEPEVRNIHGMIGSRLDPAQLEPIFTRLRSHAAPAAALAAQIRAWVFARFDPQGLPENAFEQLRAEVLRLAVSARDLERYTARAHRSLYEAPEALRVVPALDPAALEVRRDPSEESPVWMSLTSLLAGSPAVLNDYPEPQVESVRQNYSRLAEAYSRWLETGDGTALSHAFAELAAGLRRLAEAVEPIRAALPIEQRDEELIAATAYPAPGTLWAEVHYHRLDPFLWSWVLGAIAMVGFGMAFGAVRLPMFWSGITLLLMAQAFIVYGFFLRVYITGWAPVTNMFETVVFVALITGALGLYFVLQPMFATALRRAWRLTAVPGSPEVTPLKEEDLAYASQNWWTKVGWGLLGPRAVLAAAVFWLMTMVRYGSKDGYTAIRLFPRTEVGMALPSLNDWVVWAVGIAVLVFCMWFVPRAILTILAIPGLLPGSWRGGQFRQAQHLCYCRNVLGLVSAGVAVFAGLVAYYSPISGKHVNPLMPVLRDNFWLTVHVLTITASYGAGALAWGLANLSLGYFLFGRYRVRDRAGNEAVVTAAAHAPRDELSADQPASMGEETPRAKTGRWLPPAACESLSQFIYRLMQVAVLLLAAGTIFGGLWADVSWGRFWGWDSKEVWALIALLVYLAILHGRYAGMLADFGLAVGAVFGATAILIAWYGVNFVFGSGLHSYGEGTGGLGYVLTALTLNWLFVIAATIRYFIQMSLEPVAAAPPAVKIPTKAQSEPEVAEIAR